MLAAIYYKEVNSWNLFTMQQSRVSDVEFEEDESTNTDDDDESKITPDLDDDIFKEESEEKEIHALTEFF